MRRLAIALLGALAEHLAISFRTFSAIEQERIRHDISATVMQRLNFCWFTLDARGRVIDADEGAEDLLRRSQYSCGTRKMIVKKFRTNTDAWLALRSYGNAGLWGALLVHYAARGGLEALRYPALLKKSFAT